MSYVDYFPVYLDLKGRHVLIVGGGAIAMEKLHSLLPTGAKITVTSPNVTPEIRAWADAGALVWAERTFQPSDVDSAFMVVAATDDPELNAKVFHLGNQALKLTNSVDDPANCNFIMSANVRSGPMQVAVSSAGCSPALAQRIRNRIQAELLTPEVGDLADFLGSWRPEVKRLLPSYKLRQRFWESVLDAGIETVLTEQGPDGAETWMHSRLNAAVREWAA